ARDMAPLIALIADPRHVLDADGSIRLSEAQARAILELRLARLTALGRDEIAEALNRLAAEIADYLDILSSRTRLMGIIRDEFTKVKTDFATPRRFRPIGRSGAAARDAPAWRRATRISSPGCSSPRRISRCCSSPRPDR